MKFTLGIATLSTLLINTSVLAQTAKSLYVAYPKDNYETTAKQIFFIGTAGTQGEVLVNGKPIKRSQEGHFAPSFPLKIGENEFSLRYLKEEIKIRVIRLATEPEILKDPGFVENSLTAAVDISRLPGELICFGVKATDKADVSVELQDTTISLFPQSPKGELPPNSALLTNNNEEISFSSLREYKGCTSFSEIGNKGYPVFNLTLEGETVTQEGTGKVEIISPNDLEVIEVNEDQGVTRTGPSTDYSRLTPLPKGTKATVTGKEGEWLRLDYGAWIKAEETRLLENHFPPQSVIRSVNTRVVEDATEIIFPLEMPIPVSVQQGEKTITLTLYHTVAQTDTIRLDDDPIIKRLDWYQVTPDQVQYIFNLKTEQQWGYKLEYRGNLLVFTLKHPKNINPVNPLQGRKILLDPGHGGKESGAKGPTGYPEKEINLLISLLLRQKLESLGAVVYMTREEDVDLSLKERVEIINQVQPDLALSIHYNALPDEGDALKTAGVGMFWYHPQAHDLALSLHNFLVKKLNRPSYGVFWNNLALTRPEICPSILLELGFIINPEEFEWITNPEEQEKLSEAISQGISEWLFKSRN